MKPFALEDMGSLVLFAKVVELRSFSAAARDLGLAKSAVSKRIALLEKKFGVRLLVRTTRKVTPSEAGAQLHQHCAAMLTAVRGAAGVVEHGDSGERGLIRINAPGVFLQRQLLPIIEHYSQMRQRLEFDLSSDDAMIELTSGQYDLVIRITREISEQSIVARPLAKDRLVIVGAPRYFEQQGIPQTPYELVHHSCMRYAHRSAGVEWRFVNDDGPYSVGVHSAFAAGDDITLRAAAVAGMGLTIMPRCFVADELAAGDLLTVLDEHMWQPERTIYAILPEGRLAPTRVRQLATALPELVSDSLKTTG